MSSALSKICAFDMYDSNLKPVLLICWKNGLKKLRSAKLIEEYDLHSGEIGGLFTNGYKDYHPDGSWLQMKQQRQYDDQLLDYLSHERVVKQGALMQGNLDHLKQNVEILKDMKNVHVTMGRYHDGKLLLNPIEALFLVDSGRLEIYFEELLLTFQQCFHTLLTSNTISHYRIYAYLSRMGYILQEYDDSVTPYERQINIAVKINKAKEKKRRDKPVKSEEIGKNENVNVDNGIVNNSDVIIHDIKNSPLHGKCDEVAKTSHGPNCRGWFQNCTQWTNPPVPSKVTKVDSEHFEQTIDTMNDIFKDIKNINIAEMCQTIKHYLVSEVELCGDVCDWTTYKAKRAEVLSIEHGDVSVLWSGAIQPQLKPQHMYSLDSVFAKLQLDANVHLSNYSENTTQSEPPYVILFDMYKPNKNFSKSRPGKPLYRVCLSTSENAAPCLSDLQSSWQHSIDGIPLLWTVVSPSGEINCFTFTDVVLPFP